MMKTEKTSRSKLKIPNTKAGKGQPWTLLHRFELIQLASQLQKQPPPKAEARLLTSDSIAALHTIFGEPNGAAYCEFLQDLIASQSCYFKCLFNEPLSRLRTKEKTDLKALQVASQSVRHLINALSDLPEDTSEEVGLALGRRPTCKYAWRNDLLERLADL